MDAEDARCLSDIEQYGCQVIHVLAEGSLPPFSYSVGIERSSRAPEIVVIGLTQSLAHFIINEYNRRVREGECFREGARVSGFIEGFDCECRGVDTSHYREYFGWNLWLYEGPNFQVLQLVYPTTSGIWPWDVTADDSFKLRQPLLNLPDLQSSIGCG